MTCVMSTNLCPSGMVTSLLQLWLNDLSFFFIVLWRAPTILKTAASTYDDFILQQDAPRKNFFVIQWAGDLSSATRPISSSAKS